VGEVLEVLEGPRKDAPKEVQRARGKFVTDGKSGWLTMKDNRGTPILELAERMVCKSVIALTTTFDISKGKALRKLAVGETLEVLEEGQVDEKRQLTRIKVRTAKDAKDGYITIKGNQGTAYVEESSKHYCVKQKCVLETNFEPGSKEVRVVEEGEVFEMSEGPKSETLEGADRVRCRSICGDGAEGWVALAAGVQPWSLMQTVPQGAELLDASGGDANSIRKLDGGETVEALFSPEQASADTGIFMRVYAERDGALGFVSYSGCSPLGVIGVCAPAPPPAASAVTSAAGSAPEDDGLDVIDVAPAPADVDAHAPGSADAVDVDAPANIEEVDADAL